ncbi:hypothetical protein ACTNDG_03695 [Clostridium sp. HCP1S3_B4]|uniref:hypothetical protein n=1 Tax=unclassified Clostridium TaxID=2614128 RepID=UPI003F8B20DB
MSKKKKIFIVSLIISVFFILRVLIYIFFPIKTVKNIELMETNQIIQLNYDMKEIYVYWDCDRGWVMMGYDGYKFVGGASKYPQVSFNGKFPSDLSYSAYDSAVFILEGSCGDNNENVFNVKSYDLYAYYKKDSTNKSAKYLSLSDLGANIFDFRIKYIGDSEN